MFKSSFGVLDTAQSDSGSCSVWILVQAGQIGYGIQVNESQLVSRGSNQIPVRVRFNESDLGLLQQARFDDQVHDSVSGSKKSTEWFGFATRSTRVNSVKPGQLSESTRSTRLARSTQSTFSAKRHEDSGCSCTLAKYAFLEQHYGITLS
ncbi:hypothetical protein HanRHA438_Chr03g0102961 [Helianthus annuus]|uniref:Uncharacterized protein n=1 Tax=Helianthus annuus TaxID=4232 RepID=A0A251V435_HELAN|nr:hypothetical protein HanXRQr2_Chr03g0091661 [Helianthus annuus]KAJ0591756.1 hypothetical protein HanHA300_Chr03g0076921 [Helianthus annuus]KAJ0599008.1 hypothetical protein HanIR_Chr03g0099971 [Helianthus annuus]KAJ0606693.1 hypothetical protein HanHA89_Chr03g0088031 [Helianthus annuus]KAJ0766752.1 hypothetical protein HanLR1_Chr03g0081151 [Helianthus annuus]